MSVSKTLCHEKMISNCAVIGIRQVYIKEVDLVVVVEMLLGLM